MSTQPPAPVEEAPPRTWPQRMVEYVAGRTGPDRRGFLRGSTLVGAALASTPWAFISRPASAYDAVCGRHATCAEGYTVFCCTINSGRNSCPPNSFIAGWWKADHSSFCGGDARYYIDCNAFRDGAWSCRCNTSSSTCDDRRVACNQFRYGQCNTQVPYSNTGPVVCRVVSCTPPWQQYAGVCTSSSRTDNQTVTHSAPCVSGSPPQGRLDAVSLDRDRVRLQGWALDRQHPTAALRLLVSYDDHSIGVYSTTIVRADVNRAFGTTGTHGYDITVVVPGGRRLISVYAYDPDSQGVYLIGSATVSVPVDRVPVGRLNPVSSSGNKVRLQGWAYDPDRPTVAVGLHVYINGVFARSTVTEVPRGDVNRAFGITGTHGYDLQFTLPNGRRNLKVYAINPGPGSRNALIGEVTIDVNPGAVPRGAIGTVTVSGEEVRINGWAYDPDDPTVEIPVAVYQDGEGIAWFPTGLPRPDVQAAFGITGDHGFDIRIGATPGSHTWTVFAINTAGGAGNPSVGSRTARVGDAGGIGSFYELSVVPAGGGGSILRARGWAFDQRRPATEIQVGVSVDGGAMAAFPTGIPRADVNQVYSVPGDHGFDLSIPLAAGKRTIAVYALVAGGPALLRMTRVTA